MTMNLLRLFRGRNASAGVARERLQILLAHERGLRGQPDLLATLPAVAMAETMHAFDLESREVPFPIAPLPHAMVWSTTRSRDPAMTWLRDRLRPIVKNNFAGA